VDAANFQLARIDRQISDIYDRIRAVERQLPSDDAVAQAAREAGILQKAAGEARGAFALAQPALLQAVTAAALAARRMTDARGTGDAIRAKLAGLQADFS